jgi:hypothetical protein
VNQTLETVLQRIDDCCSEDVYLVHHNGSEFLSVPKCCDNRICENPDCKRHRGYQHVKDHFAQMEYAKKYIDAPKSFIFTGWRLKANATPEYIRKFSQKKLTKLFWVLKSINEHLVNYGRKPSPFCVFMEFKIYQDGSVYLHFHVITGTIGDFHHAQALWGRFIKYEYPIVSDEKVIAYVRKYTGKTPVIYVPNQKPIELHANQNLRLKYLEIVYKLQMARYSKPRKEAIEEFGLNIKSCWYMESQLLSALKGALRRGRGRNWDGVLYNKEFLPLLDKPPNPESDVPTCVYIFPVPAKPTIPRPYKPIRSEGLTLGEFVTEIPKNSDRKNYILVEENYPKHYLCVSEKCSTSEGIGRITSSKICDICGGECVE